MLHLTVSYFAWIVVVLIQAFVHFWILKGSRRRDGIDLGTDTSSLDKMDAHVADDRNVFNLRNHKVVEPDDQVPPMVPHVQLSEDEYEEESEQESFDGDEPLLFFELLDKTGSEMIKSCSSLESLIHEQLINVDAVETALASTNPTIHKLVDLFAS